MTIDLEPCRRRAMILRGGATATKEEASSAVAHASDDILRLVREVEVLRAASSQEALDLASKLSAVRLIPVDAGSLCDLSDEIAVFLCRFARERAPKKGQPATWDIGAGLAAVNVLAIVDAYVQKQIKPGERA